MSNSLSETIVNKTAREVTDFIALCKRNRLLAAAVLIILATAAYLQFSSRIEAPIDSTESPTEVVTNSQSSPPPRVQVDGDAMAIRNGDLLVLKSKTTEGLAVVSLIHGDNCRATYEWRFKESPSSLELFGTGKVFEQYGYTDASGRVTNLGASWISRSAHSKRNGRAIHNRLVGFIEAPHLTCLWSRIDHSPTSQCDLAPLV